MKKLSLPLGLMLLFVAAAPTFAGFRDVPPSHVYSEGINYVQAEGIVQGYSDGTYRPGNSINRAEFIKIIVAAKYKPEEIDTCLDKNLAGTSKYVFFPDVPRGEWYAKYVCLGKVKEIINGDKDGNFRPTDNIIFPEAAKVIIEGFHYLTVTSAPWYKQYVDALAERKAIPTSIQNFAHEITRAEMAEIIWRLKAEVTTKETATFFSLEENE